MKTNDTSWIADAICKGKTSLFFVPPGNEKKQEKHNREMVAMTYCRQCPVMLQCRDYGRANDELGIWGGENEEMRWKAGYLRGRNYRVVKSLKKRFPPQQQQVTDLLSEQNLDSTAH